MRFFGAYSICVLFSGLALAQSDRGTITVTVADPAGAVVSGGAAIGPRLGAAYQIDSKTVLRMGAGLAYGTAPNQANVGRTNGEVIRVPASNNGLTRHLARTDNPAVWGGGNTYFNRVEGQPLLNFEPNRKCFDPTTLLVLNKDAWVDAPAGTFSTSAPYYGNYRWQRQPSESLSLGRTFGLTKDNRLKLDLRTEFFNVFNRLFLASPAGVGNAVNGQPAGPNPAAPTTRNAAGGLTAGYGFVNTFNGNGTQPRTGQIVARFSF